MATIGTFKKDGDEFSGTLETLTMKANITLIPNAKKSDAAPDYRVFQQTEEFTSEIGAAWKKSAKDGSEYLSVSLDDPSFADKINCRLIKTSIEHSYTLFWERQRPKD
jgi:uncharacterized protein (DUF736 family)